MEKESLIITYLVIIVARRAILLKCVSLGNILFLKELLNGFPNATLISVTFKDLIKVGYLFPLFDSTG